MTSLGCNVTNCGYNEDRCCCRTEIEVMGSKAEEKDCTCCGSFDSDCDCRNSVSGPKESLYVHCEAANCIYNEDLVCSADRIDIQGASANNAGQTICASFTCK